MILARTSPPRQCHVWVKVGAARAERERNKKKTELNNDKGVIRHSFKKMETRVEKINESVCIERIEFSIHT